jgi:hypothetical protein
MRGGVPNEAPAQLRATIEITGASQSANQDPPTTVQRCDVSGRLGGRFLFGVGEAELAQIARNADPRKHAEDVIGDIHLPPLDALPDA